MVIILTSNTYAKTVKVPLPSCDVFLVLRLRSWRWHGDEVYVHLDEMDPLGDTNLS